MFSRGKNGRKIDYFLVSESSATSKDIDAPMSLAPTENTVRNAEQNIVPSCIPQTIEEKIQEIMKIIHVSREQAIDIFKYSSMWTC